MRLFFHIQRAGVGSFRSGKSDQTNWGQNHYIRDIFAVGLTVPLRGASAMPVDAVLKDALDETGLGHFRRLDPKSEDASRRRLLEHGYEVLRHQAKLLREYIFEEIRQREFPEKPSRMKGMWLLPHDEAILRAWCASSPYKRFRVWEVEAAGKFHYGYAKYLEPSALGGAEIGERARRYWKDVPQEHTPEAELLFEGQFTVLREVEALNRQSGIWASVKKKVGF